MDRPMPTPWWGWPTLALPQNWLRGPARLERGWIVLDRDRAVEYDLTTEFPAETMLLFEIANIRRPPDALEFVGRFGLLWNGPQSETHREEFDAWDKAAHRLRTILGLYEMLQAVQRGEQDVWERLQGAAASIEDIWQEMYPGEGPATTDEQVYERLSHFVQGWINSGLKGTETVVLTASQATRRYNAGFVLAALSPHLLGAAYHQLALLVTQHQPVLPCIECGRFFIISDKRQQYCSKTCSGRARYRRWADKNKQGQGEV